jgi:hypothetical protein
MYGILVGAYISPKLAPAVAKHGDLSSSSAWSQTFGDKFLPKEAEQEAKNQDASECLDQCRP